MFNRLALILGFACFVFSSAALVSAETRYSVTDLGTLSGGPWEDYSATGINADGQVVGWALENPQNGQTSFLYSNGAMTEVFVGFWSTPSDINDFGVIVGKVNPKLTNSALGPFKGFIDSNGNVIASIGGINGLSNSAAIGINNSGLVAGISYNQFDGHQLVTSYSRAFLYNSGTITNLGTLGGDYQYSSRNK